MRKGKWFHLIGIISLMAIFTRHSINTLFTQLDPIKDLGQIYVEMKKVQFQQSPWIADFYDIYILLNWSFSIFLLFWISINLHFLLGNMKSKKTFLFINALISVLNLGIEFRYNYSIILYLFMLITLCFVTTFFLEYKSENKN